MSNHSFEGEQCDGHMGLMSSFRWKSDPKTVLFMLARYKWASRMLEGKHKVVEIGCGDAFGSRLVAESVGHLHCFDQDDLMIKSAAPHPKITYHAGRFVRGVSGYPYDAAYALDVVEHMNDAEMHGLLFVLHEAVNGGIVIIGSPSLESQRYASPLSKANHINCMTQPQLREAMLRHFKNVLMFSMNDEIVGTGFSPMSHYNIAVGV